MSSGDVLLELQIFSDIDVPNGELYPCELETAVLTLSICNDAESLLLNQPGMAVRICFFRMKIINSYLTE